MYVPVPKIAKMKSSFYLFFWLIWSFCSHMETMQWTRLIQKKCSNSLHFFQWSKVKPIVTLIKFCLEEHPRGREYGITKGQYLFQTSSMTVNRCDTGYFFSRNEHILRKVAAECQQYFVQHANSVIFHFQ